MTESTSSAAATPAAADNPLFQEWTAPFGAPPFGRIRAGSTRPSTISGAGST